MITKTLSLTNQSFQISAGQVLAVKISMDAVEFCVLDSAKKMVVALESWNIDVAEEIGAFANALEKIKSDSSILNKEYARTLVIPDNPYYTFIPNTLFIETEARKYFEFTHIISSDEIMNVDNIAELAVKNIYMLPFEADGFFRKSLTQFEYRHLTTVLIKAVLKSKTLQDKVLVNFDRKRMDIVIAMAGKLKFCNSFKFETDEDMLYFLLNVYKQLGFDTNMMPLVLNGEIEKESSLFNLIYKYVRNVSFAENADTIKLAPFMATVRPHNYFTLFNSFTCE